MLRSAIVSSLAAFASADINVDYHDLLHGLEELRAGHLQPLWSQFKTEFEHLSPIDLDEDSMFSFFDNVDKIITHNKKSEKTYTVGINNFSAMNFE